MKKEEKRRIELTTWHETGHAVVAMKYGLIPERIIIGLHGIYGVNDYYDWPEQSAGLTKRQKMEIGLAGYAWEKLYYGETDDQSFFVEGAQYDGSDWNEVGRPTFEKAHKMMEKFYPDHEQYSEVSHEIHDWLIENGVLFEDDLRAMRKEFFS